MTVHISCVTNEIQYIPGLLMDFIDYYFVFLYYYFTILYYYNLNCLLSIQYPKTAHSFTQTPAEGCNPSKAFN